MRGEFLGVWQETWREIWEPLVNEDDVPADIFCELYRELDRARKPRSPEEVISTVIDDPVQCREVFDRALIASEIEVDGERRDTAYGSVDVDLLTNTDDRRRAIEAALVQIIGDADRSRGLLAQALTEMANDPQKWKEAHERALESIINDREKSREAFKGVSVDQLTGEQSIVQFIEAAYDILEDLGDDELANRYYDLLRGFLDKFSLRYDLRRPCVLCPTLPGLFAGLVRELRATTSTDAHLNTLMRDFEESLRDLRTDASENRVKTCIQKQVNLLEAMGRQCTGVTRNTLGGICDQVGSWPHEKVKEAMKNLYGFASDYPGIRHGGTPANALRSIDMRDLVAMSILLAGFTAYLNNGFSAEAVYRGS